MALGWLYIVGLTHPDLLPAWVLNTSLFTNAVAFGVSYGVDAIIRGRTTIPREFWLAVTLQAVFMVVVGVIGALLSSSAPLIIGLLCMEALPNIPGGLSFVADLFREMRQQNQTWWYKSVLTYSAAFGIGLCLLMVICSAAIFVQSYALFAAGITICILQATPWMQVGLRACIEWTKHPARALFWLITLLIGTGAVCMMLAAFTATKGYSESELVAIWYSIARVPSAVCLGTFGMIGVALVGARARIWRYLILVSSGAVGVGFLWFVVALLTSRAIIAPGLLMQVTGGVNVTVVYIAFNSTPFRAMANAMKLSWGNTTNTTATSEGEDKGEN